MMNHQHLAVPSVPVQSWGLLYGKEEALRAGTIFQDLNLPFFAPPSQLFGIVWSILYLLMGVSFYLVAQTNSEEKPFALSLYVVQLFFNVTWCIVFFILRTYFVAFITAVLLECLVICMVAWFLKADKIAGILQIPYMLWVMYASMLSFGIYLLN